MSRSSDPDHFFQTSDSLAEKSRKATKSTNNYGTPIRLQSKILAVLADPSSSSRVYLAEAAGTARKIDIDTSSTIALFRGPTTPLTCLALYPLSLPYRHDAFSPPTTLFAGSWDKTIWSWSLTTRAPGIRYRGHTDFVKCVLVLHFPTLDILISGSSDSNVIIWNLATGAKLHTLRGHGRGVLALALDPLSYPAPEIEGERNHRDRDESTTLFSASSDKAIIRWSLSPATENNDKISASPLPDSTPIIAHETSVYALLFSSPTSLDLDANLWTASADGMVKCLNRERGWEPDTVLHHKDYVRTVALSEDGRWVISAGRDEDVKVWDISKGELWHKYEGHYDEVTGLVILPGKNGVEGGERVVSVSIDGTVRVWSLSTEELDQARKVAEARREGVVEEVGQEEAKAIVVNGGLSTEEERELAELMED